MTTPSTTRRQRLERAGKRNRRTFEEKLKFDSGLPLGTSLVTFCVGKHERVGLVDITSRGNVRVLMQPSDSDMYSSWSRVRGDTLTSEGGVIVWGARNPEIMEIFEGEPVAKITVDT